MSKMSEIAMLLDDQAVELGFESYEEAIAKGYEVDYEERKLVNPYVLDREQEKAHEAWLKEKKKVLDRLRKARVSNDEKKIDTALIKAIKFIEGVRSE